MSPFSGRDGILYSSVSESGKNILFQTKQLTNHPIFGRTYLYSFRVWPYSRVIARSGDFFYPKSATIAQAERVPQLSQVLYTIYVNDNISHLLNMSLFFHKKIRTYL